MDATIGCKLDATYDFTAGSGLSSPEGALSGPYNTEHYNTQGKVIKEGRAQLQGLLDEAIMGPLSILLQV